MDRIRNTGLHILIGNVKGFQKMYIKPYFDKNKFRTLVYYISLPGTHLEKLQGGSSFKQAKLFLGVSKSSRGLPQKCQF